MGLWVEMVVWWRGRSGGEIGEVDVFGTYRIEILKFC